MQNSHWSAIEAFCAKHNLGFLPVRFRLRTLLIVTALLAIVFGFIGNVMVHVRRQTAIAARIKEAGGEWSFHAEYEPYGSEPELYLLCRRMFGEHACRHIKQVNFYQNKPVDAELALLQRLPQLGMVRLVGNKLTDQSLAHIARCRNLQSIKLQGYPYAQFSPAGIAQLGQLPRLRRLAVVDLDEAQLREVGKFSQLEQLKIQSAYTNPAVLAEIARLPKLKELEIKGCNDFDHETCAALTGLQQLEALELYKIPLNAHDYQQLARLPKLSYLYTWECPGLDAEAATALRQCSGLKRLMLGRCCNDEILAALAGLPELEVLNISGSAVTDASAPVMLQFPKLSWLSIQGTPITLKGLYTICSARQLKNIYTSVQMPDADFQELSRMGRISRNIHKGF
jgi:hypothetical protein